MSNPGSGASMRLIGIPFAVLFLLTGCSSGSNNEAKSAQQTSTGTTSSTTNAPAPTDPIASEITADKLPPCRLIVGQPTDVAVRGVEAKGVVNLRCFTGASLETDDTGAGVTHCDIVTDTGKAIYYWASQDPGAADQHVYAAKAGGVVVVVPGETAKLFFSVGGGMASVLLAVGPC